MKQCVFRTYLRNISGPVAFGIAMLTALMLSGCWFRNATSKIEPSKIPAGSTIKAPVTDALEIFWRIPDVEIDGFVLSYGFTQDKLTERLRINKEELTVMNDEIWGPVFRYLLKDVPKNQTIFFTLESFKGDQYSPPSVVQRAEGK